MLGPRPRALWFFAYGCAVYARTHRRPLSTVKPGTRIFVAASSAECSTFKDDTHPPSEPPWTEAQLRTCAIEADKTVAATVKVDGNSVPVAEAETPLLNIVLPEGNTFNEPKETKGQSVGYGWGVLLHPLWPGTHKIEISTISIPDKSKRPVKTNITTKIVVKRHDHDNPR